MALVATKAFGLNSTVSTWYFESGFCGFCGLMLDEIRHRGPVHIDAHDGEHTMVTATAPLCDACSELYDERRKLADRQNHKRLGGK